MDDTIRSRVAAFLLALPILFWPVLLLGAVVLIMEFSERRRFSLRTLMIVTTLVAVLLGLITYAVRLLSSTR